MIVKCAQTSKKYTAKIQHLSREDGYLLTEADLQKGSELMWNYNGKDWPVTFVEWKDGTYTQIGLCNLKYCSLLHIL